VLSIFLSISWELSNLSEWGKTTPYNGCGKCNVSSNHEGRIFEVLLYMGKLLVFFKDEQYLYHFLWRKSIDISKTLDHAKNYFQSVSYVIKNIKNIFIF